MRTTIFGATAHREYERELLRERRRAEAADRIAATRQIRDLGELYDRLPIIAVSASVRMGGREENENGGFTAFVGKPIRPDLLFRTLADCTGRF